MASNILAITCFQINNVQTCQNLYLGAREALTSSCRHTRLTESTVTLGVNIFCSDCDRLLEDWKEDAISSSSKKLLASLKSLFKGPSREEYEHFPPGRVRSQKRRVLKPFAARFEKYICITLQAFVFWLINWALGKDPKESMVWHFSGIRSPHWFTWHNCVPQGPSPAPFDTDNHQ